MEGEDMNSKMRELINKLAEDVIETCNINIQDSIENIVNKLGGRVEETSSLSSFDGAIIKTNDYSFVIRISAFQSETRKRFTVAHEIGHLFLHMGYMIDSSKWEEQKMDVALYFRNGNSELEYEANEFAAALLMPRQMYKNILDLNTNGTHVDTIKIANYFKVSEDAASLRGKFLGYLEW